MLVKTAVEKFGGVHILIANAGILRDKSFVAMTEQEWDAVIAVRPGLSFSTSWMTLNELRSQVHLRGTYKCAKAVWPIFQKQKYGRIVTTASQVGICECFCLQGLVA
jgi:multifunctional beta-oxidation protein